MFIRTSIFSLMITLCACFVSAKAEEFAEFDSTPAQEAVRVKADFHRNGRIIPFSITSRGVHQITSTLFFDEGNTRVKSYVDNGRFYTVKGANDLEVELISGDPAAISLFENIMALPHFYFKKNKGSGLSTPILDGYRIILERDGNRGDYRLRDRLRSASLEKIVEGQSPEVLRTIRIDEYHSEVKLTLVPKELSIFDGDLNPIGVVRIKSYKVYPNLPDFLFKVPNQ